MSGKNTSHASGYSIADELRFIDPQPAQPHADSDPGHGRRLALDVGSVRIGVAMSDPDGILATPVETVAASVDGSDVVRVAELVRENSIVEVVVGLPVALRGNHTSSTENALYFAEDLAELLSEDSGDKQGKHDTIPIRMVDERMSTMAATQALQASGVSAKKGRKKIDQAAAVHILQGWLDARRRLF